MQHFRAPDFALLCRDIPTLAHAYRKTFDFWHSQQEALQTEVFELRYEAFVDDFDACTRRVFDFLELPWDDRGALSGEAGAREAIHQHAELLAGGAADQCRLDRPLAALRRAHFTASLPLLAPYFDRWNYRT